MKSNFFHAAKLTNLIVLTNKILILLIIFNKHILLNICDLIIIQSILCLYYILYLLL